MSGTPTHSPAGAQRRGPDSDADRSVATGRGGRGPWALITALVIGFAGIPAITFFCHWYEIGVHENARAMEVIICALAPAVFFLMLLVAAVINPLLRWIARPLAMQTRELFLILSLWLATGAVGYVTLTTPMLAIIGNLNSPATEKPVIQRVALKSYLKRDLFLPEDASKDYYYGKSPDGASLVRALPRAAAFSPEDFTDLPGMANALVDPQGPLPRMVHEHLSVSTREALRELLTAGVDLRDLLRGELNRVLRGPLLYTPRRFQRIPLTEDVQRRMEAEPTGAELVRLNRRLLRACFPNDVAEVPPGTVDGLLKNDDLGNVPVLANEILTGTGRMATYLRAEFSDDVLREIDGYTRTYDRAAERLSEDLNDLLEGPVLALTKAGRSMDISKEGVSLFNRVVLMEGYPAVFKNAGKFTSWEFDAAELHDPQRLAVLWRERSDPLSRAVWKRLPAEARETIENFAPGPEGAPSPDAAAEPEKAERPFADAGPEFAAMMAKLCNDLRDGPLLTGAAEHIDWSRDARVVVNRAVLEDRFAHEISGVPFSVPWDQWRGPLLFWVPFILLTLLFSASLVRTVHRQWSRHELLSYPLASVANGFVERSGSRVFPDIFYRKVFWIGAAIPIFIYTINGLHRYFPVMVEVPLAYRHYELIKNFEFLGKYCGREAYALFRGMVYPFIVAIAVLLPAELSLTCWLGWILLVFGTGFYFLLTGEVITSTETGSIQYGMYIAMAVTIFMIGRREYFNILRHALIPWRGGGDRELRRAAGACRVFFLSFAGLWAMLAFAGLDVFIGFVLVASFGLIVLLMARMTAETGIPWLVQLQNQAIGLPLKLLGAAAVGPQGLAVIAATGLVLSGGGTANANMFVVQETTYGKLREGMSGWVKGTGFNIVLALGILLAVSTSVFFTLRDNYSFGAQQEGLQGALAGHMEQAATSINRLRIDGRLETAEEATGLAKLRMFELSPSFWRFFLIGGGLVGLCAFLRLRHSWWPFHPLPLLFINSWTMSRLYLSILIGWVIKMAILKIWGGKTFASAKPFFIGVIVGQIGIFGVWVIVSVIYYLVTGSKPPPLRGMIIG